jgi:hypothetical protein
MSQTLVGYLYVILARRNKTAGYTAHNINRITQTHISNEFEMFVSLLKQSKEGIVYIWQRDDSDNLN